MNGIRLTFGLKLIEFVICFGIKNVLMQSRTVHHALGRLHPRRAGRAVKAFRTFFDTPWKQILNAHQFPDTNFKKLEENMKTKGQALEKTTIQSGVSKMKNSNNEGENGLGSSIFKDDLELMGRSIFQNFLTNVENFGSSNQTGQVLSKSPKIEPDSDVDDDYTGGISIRSLERIHNRQQSIILDLQKLSQSYLKVLDKNLVSINDINRGICDSQVLMKGYANDFNEQFGPVNESYLLSDSQKLILNRISDLIKNFEKLISVISKSDGDAELGKTWSADEIKLLNTIEHDYRLILDQIHVIHENFKKSTSIFSFFQPKVRKIESNQTSNTINTKPIGNVDMSQHKFMNSQEFNNESIVSGIPQINYDTLEVEKRFYTGLEDSEFLSKDVGHIKNTSAQRNLEEKSYSESFCDSVTAENIDDSIKKTDSIDSRMNINFNDSVKTDDFRGLPKIEDFSNSLTTDDSNHSSTTAVNSNAALEKVNSNGTLETVNSNVALETAHFNDSLRSEKFYETVRSKNFGTFLKNYDAPLNRNLLGSVNEGDIKDSSDLENSKKLINVEHSEKVFENSKKLLSSSEPEESVKLEKSKDLIDPEEEYKGPNELGNDSENLPPITKKFTKDNADNQQTSRRRTEVSFNYTMDKNMTGQDTNIANSAQSTNQSIGSDNFDPKETSPIIHQNNNQHDSTVAPDFNKDANTNQLDSKTSNKAVSSNHGDNKSPEKRKPYAWPALGGFY